MKELIVVIGLTILGCLIFNMIAGDGDSLRMAGRDVMEKNIEVYKELAG